MAFQISGDVKTGTTPLARTVRAYLRSSGALAGSTTSDGGDGAFAMFVPSNGEHYVVALDTSENALIFDRVTPLTVVSQGVLDSHEMDVAAAYSLRRLFTNYSGPLIRVRNAGGTEIDIDFDSNGVLDAAALGTHIGSGDGFVTTWYDQASGGNHLVRATSSEQPRIATTGVIHSRVRFDGTDDTMVTQSALTATAAKSIYYTGIPFSVNPGTGTPVAWQLTGTTPLIMSFNYQGVVSQPINQASSITHADAPMSDAARAYIINAATGGSFAAQVLLRTGALSYPPSGTGTATNNPVGGGVATLGGIPGQSNYGALHISSFVVYNAAHAAATADAIEALLNF